MSVKQKTILYGAPFAWLHLIDNGTISLVASFDNLASKPAITLPKSATEAAGGDNIDINRADTGIYRFKKDSPVIDGVTEELIAAASSGSDATGKGKISIVTNQAPLEVTFTSWTKFIAFMKENLGKKWLITVPTGFSYTQRNSTKKPDGFVHMIGKISNDLSDANAPSTFQMDFDSYDITGTDCDSTDLPTTGFWGTAKKIVYKLGGGTNDVDIVVPEFISDDVDKLVAGDVAFVENPQV